MRSLQACSVLLACCALAAACASSDGAPAASTDAGTSSDTGPMSNAESVAFEPASLLTLAPGERATLRVVVAPAGVHQVRLSLVGNSLDASLDTDLLYTHEDGRADVVLTAPQSATTFRVRAVADDGPSADAPVSVSGTGFATLTVVPQYTGTRKTDVWVATGAALVACAEKKGIPPPDGSIMASAPQGDELVLEGLPAGPKLSITVRSGQAVGGCADLPRLNPGEQRTLTIKAQDRPIELAQTDVSLELVLMPDGLALQGWLEAETGDFVEAFAPEACEVCALLDGMEAHAPDADAFHQAREAQGWDNLVSDYLESLGKSLGDRLRTWSAKGAVSLLGGMGLSGRLTADGSCPSHPTLRLETVGGISAAKAGADYPYTTTMTADPGDTLHIGGTVYLLPSAFIGGAIDVAASAATVVDARDALRQVVGCQALSAVLAAGGGLPASCGAACLTKLCEASIDTLWQRATSSSADSFESANLSFTVSASAKVDEAAVLTSWEGSWAGEFAGGPWEAVPLKGAASGAASP